SCTPSASASIRSARSSASATASSRRSAASAATAAPRRPTWASAGASAATAAAAAARTATTSCPRCRRRPRPLRTCSRASRPARARTDPRAGEQTNRHARASACGGALHRIKRGAEHMDIKKLAELMGKYAHGYFATVDEAGFPDLRGWEFQYEKDGRMYFTTSSEKSVYRQMMANPK